MIGQSANPRQGGSVVGTVASVKRIAALTPQLKLVLGAHSIPVAQPSVLPRVVGAIQSVRAGKGEVKPAGAGKAIHSIVAFLFFFTLLNKRNYAHPVCR